MILPISNIHQFATGPLSAFTLTASQPCMPLIGPLHLHIRELPQRAKSSIHSSCNVHRCLLLDQLQTVGNAPLGNAQGSYSCQDYLLAD